MLPPRVSLQWLGMLLLVAGCAQLPEQGTDPLWPAGLPSRAVFVVYWERDNRNRQLQSRDDYLLWVQRFYEGYNLVPGWLDVTGTVLGSLPVEEQEPIGQRLRALGTRIGAEWAKDNAVRRIATRHAAVWRDALLESLALDDLPRYLEKVEADVAALLEGRLADEDVRFERYYVDAFDF